MTRVDAAIVYETATGRIVRAIRNSVPVEAQNTETGEALLTSAETAIPDSTEGKLVDTSTDPPTVVDDPDYTVPPPTFDERVRQVLREEGLI